MTYEGRVRVGGPVDVRTLDELEIRKTAVGPMANDAYLLTCRATGEHLLVDAAAEPARLLGLLASAAPTAEPSAAPARGPGAARVTIVTTHRHHDHVGALADVVAATGAPVAAGADDADAITAATGVAVGRRLSHGDVITVGRSVVEVVALRGHTPGSVALAYREPTAAREPGAVPGRVHLFTGDSLFPGGVGNTDRDPARFARLLDDVTTRVFDRFGDDTWVYPGHGDDTTLGAERPHLAEWRQRGW